MADNNELAELVSQVQSLSDTVSEMSGTVTGLKNELASVRKKAEQAASNVASLTITDDCGVFSGSGMKIRANFANLPDPLVTATINCDTVPPTITINVST